MKREYSAGAVLFTRDENDELKFVLVIERSGHCGFPKGHIEHGESEETAAIREIREETGVDAVLVGDFRSEVEYTIGTRIKKHVTYFLAEYQNSSKAERGDDIRTLKILNYKDAYRLLTHDTSRDILQKASEYISTLATV